MVLSLEYVDETRLQGEELEHGMRFHRRRYAVRDTRDDEDILRLDFRYPLADGVEEPEYVVHLDSPPRTVPAPDDWTDGPGTYTADFTQSHRIDALFHDVLDRYDDTDVDGILGEVKEEMLEYAYQWSADYVP